MRVPYMRREKCAYIKMRRVGLSLNQIAEAFGRSTSCVWRTIKNAESYGVIRRYSLRKLPNLPRRRSAKYRHITLMKLLPKWISWILGEKERPP